MARPLSQVEKDLASTSLESLGFVDRDTLYRLLDEVRVVVGSPKPEELGVSLTDAIAFIAIMQGREGITMGDTIYVAPGTTYADGSLPMKLLLHEVVHVVQQDRLGRSKFLSQYLAEYARNQLSGMGSDEAYRNISFEKEAYELETRAGQKAYQEAEKKRQEELERFRREEQKKHSEATRRAKEIEDWTFSGFKDEPEPVQEEPIAEPASAARTGVNLPARRDQGSGGKTLVIVGLGAAALYLVARGLK